MSTISSRAFLAQICLETSPRSVRRICLNPDVLKSAKICAGDVVAVYPDEGVSQVKTYVVGIAWPSAEIPTDALALSPGHCLSIGIRPGSNVRLACLAANGPGNRPLGVPTIKDIREAGSIQLTEDKDSNDAPRNSSMSKKSQSKSSAWLLLLVRELLVDLKYLRPTQLLEVMYEGRARRFRVSSLSAERTPNVAGEDLVTRISRLSIENATWIVGWDTSVTIVEPIAKKEIDITITPPRKGVDAYTTVGGLSTQIEQIRDLLEIPLTQPELFQHLGLKPPRGILLHGPPGTGKTHLAKAIAASTNSAVLIVNGPELSSAYHGETESKLREVFKDAQAKSPCIVVLDEIDALVPRREDSAGGEVEKRVVATLLTILDGMESSASASEDRVVVIGTTNRPNAIDPALRRPGRFDREIEIGVPDADARLSIMSVLLAKVPHDIPLDDLRALTSRAHGYVGADLSAVVREAGTLAIKRWMKTNPNEPLPTLKLALADLEASLPTVRPSAMRSLLFEAPPVRYVDIGGQEHNIQKLKETVEWPLLHPEAFLRLGVRPPKGILLYGPPGCSKTVLARACACESGVNFVAVKGPELLNKYVGESERAVREIFRKARAASPSIIFFDEIDALASSRSSAEDGQSAAHEGVLTSLLNEMDGVQELLGVTIIAATNRPDAIDTALMRPGRLDRILFVGPPDHAGREQILRIQMRKMSVATDVNAAGIATIAEGCSGAEMVALCQEAAMNTMRKDMNASVVSQDAFISAARLMKRQITPAVIQSFVEWGENFNRSSR